MCFSSVFSCSYICWLSFFLLSACLCHPLSILSPFPNPPSSHSSIQMYQSSPGGQSSCSSEPSPLGSATNNDSGVEMAAHSGGSLGDLSTLDDLPFVDTLGFEDSAGGVAAVGLHFRNRLGTSQLLEHLKKEKLKTVRDSCRWASNPKAPVLGTKLPPIPASGESKEKQHFYDNS